MKQEPTRPHLPDRLQDPKLPVIHAGGTGSRMENHRSDAPYPQSGGSLRDTLS